jgi:DNA recombination protein RmuC
VCKGDQQEVHHPPHTLEFAILFIPTESLYAEVLRQPGLFERIKRGLAAAGCNRVRQYGTVVNALAKQLTTASNSVESLGRRTRAMSRKLKDVELLSDHGIADKLLGLSDEEILDGGFQDAAPLVEDPTAEIVVRNSRSIRAKH